MADFATGLRRGARPSLIKGDTRTPEEFEADSNAAAAAAYGDFGGGLASAVRGAVGATKSYAAAGLDAAGLREAAQRAYESAAEDNARAQAIAPEIATTDQITDLETAGRYALGKIGGAGGSLPLGLAGGVAGRLLARSGAGALGGAAAAYQPVMAGGHVQDLNANPNTAGMDPGEKLLRSTTVGTGQAVLEGAVPGYFANRFLKRAPVAPTVRGRFKDTAKEALGGAAAEGGFAAGSDVIGQGAMIQADPNVQYDARQTFEAGIGEAVGGVGITAPAAAVNTGLDYLSARGKQVGNAAADAVNTVRNAAPGAVQKGANTASEAGSLFKSTASSYLQHPELAALVAAQELPPELDGASQGEILDWMARDDGQRQQAAINIVQRTLADPNATETARTTAQALLDNPGDPESWKPFADGIIAKHRREQLGSKLGRARSQLSGWIEKTRSKAKSNLEPTTQDIEFTDFIREPLAQKTYESDPVVQDEIAALLNDYVLEDFASGEDGPRVPEGLVDALGEHTAEMVELAYDTLRRQGRTQKLDATAKDKLAVVKQLVDTQLAARDTAASVVEQQLTPTMLRQVPKDALPDIASGIRDYLRNRDRKNTEYNAAVEAQLDQMFGPNKEALLEQLAALDKPLKAQSFVDMEKPVDPDGVDSDDTGSDAVTDDDFESDLREVAPARNYHFKGDKGKAPFDIDDPFLKRNIDLAIAKVDPSRVATQLNKSTLKSEARMDKVGVVDYAKATGDNSVVDALSLKYPEISLEALNNRFFVLSTEEVGIDESDPIDIKPLELVRPATRNGKPNKASWQDVTRIDSKKGNIDTSTIAHGRVYLTPGTPEQVNKETGEVTPATKQGKEFITSAQKLITKMWEKKKQGAFDDRTAEKTGADDMLAMFAAGLSSLQATGKFHGEMQIKMPDGTMKVINGSDFPNEFVLYQGKNFKVTVGDARGATSKAARAKKQSKVQFDEQGKEVTPKKPSEKFESADIPNMTLSELREEFANVRTQIERLDKKIAEGKGEGDLREIRDALQTKLDKLEAAGAKRTSDRQPTEGEVVAKEAAGKGVSETDEMSAATRAKKDAKVRKYDEETGLELHPREITGKFLRDTHGESTSTPVADAEAAKDISKLEAAIARYHGEQAAVGAYEAVAIRDQIALDQIAKVFGARVRGFKTTGDKAKYDFFSGVYLDSNREVIYLNDASSRPHMALLGHELVHQMRNTSPALYAKFEAAVAKHIKPEAYKAWSKMFSETGDKLREEFMAEVVSDGMMDGAFWEALAKKDMNLAKQVYASMMRLFRQIMASVGYTPKTKSVLDDYTAVMKIAGEVMAEHGATALVKMNENQVRTPEGAMFSLEDPAGKPVTAEQKEEVEVYIEKTLGKDVAKIFTDQLKGSGEWSRDPDNQKATIKIATTALNPLSVAHHEAMHEFFQRLMDGKHEQSARVLTNAASSLPVRRAMERIFAGNDRVLKQIETDPEERVAYMFQLWAAGKIKIGPETESVFRKIANVIRRVLGLMSDEQRATAILEAFHDGKFAEPSAMTEILGTEEARSAWLKNVGGKTKPVLDRAGEWVGFAENALTGSDNPNLDWIGRQMHNKTGSQGDEQGFLSAKEQANNKYMNKFANALRGVDLTGKDKRVAAKEDIELALIGLQTKEFHADPVIRRVQDQVVAVFKEMYGYLEEASVKRLDEKTHKWVPIRRIDDYRIPVAWDPAKIISDSKRFKELLFQHHEAELAAIAEKANKETATGKDAAKYSAAWDKLKNPDAKPITAEGVAVAIVNRLINSNGQPEVKESENALGFSPFMKSVNERTLHWIDQSVFHEFQEKDIVKIISSYVGQATKRAEYSRRFGPDGSVLEEKMQAAWQFEVDRLKKEGAEGDVEHQALQRLEPARRAVMAMEGTLGHDISVALRKASAYTIVYQNMRLLGYALFSNIVDPLGVIVRGGEMQDAYAAFKRGIQGVVRDWGDLTGLRKEKESDRDEATRIAEMIGTVDSAGFMSQMGTLYSSQYLPGWAKEMNDKFFRWNGLEAFNKAMRVQATQAAISFIKRHYEKPNEHSERYFKELGLSRDDVRIGDDGALNVENRQVQQAIMRWVDGAILRPNAAIRPTMSSDPHYAIFYHLKQFMYAMHATILKRVQIEIQNGNTDPLLLLMAGYVPVMIAADAAKGLIQVATGGGEPHWQNQGVAGVVAHGVQRAGLLGVYQMVPDTVAHGVIEQAGPAVGQVADAVVDPLPQTVAEATMLGPLNMALKGASWGN